MYTNADQNKAIINRINLQLEEIKNSNYKDDQILKLINRLNDWSSDIADNFDIINNIHLNYFNLINHILNNKLIKESNVNQLLPEIVKNLYTLKIGDSNLWAKIEEIYFANIDNIELPSHLTIINNTVDLFTTHIKNQFQPKVRDGFFDFILAFEMRDFLNLDLKNLILFLAIYADKFTKNRKLSLIFR